MHIKCRLDAHNIWADGTNNDSAMINRAPCAAPRSPLVPLVAASRAEFDTRWRQGLGCAGRLSELRSSQPEWLTQRSLKTHRAQVSSRTNPPSGQNRNYSREGHHLAGRTGTAVAPRSANPPPTIPPTTAHQTGEMRFL